MARKLIGFAVVAFCFVFLYRSYIFITYCYDRVVVTCSFLVVRNAIHFFNIVTIEFNVNNFYKSVCSTADIHHILLKCPSA